MAAVQKNKERPALLEIKGDMTLYEIAELHQTVKASLVQRRGATLDLSGVAACDAAGLQLLCSVARTAAESGTAAVLRNVPETVREAARRAGIQSASLPAEE